MVFAALVALTLAVDPAAEPAVAEKAFNVAAPGLSAIEADAGKADFLNDYLAEQLSNEGGGRIKVITANEVAAVLGNERQRQLLGCSDKSSSCIAELAGALGSDAVIVGNVARFGTTYAMTVKVISARDASTLASTSVRDLKEEELPGWIARAAKQLADKLVPNRGTIVAAAASSSGSTSVATPQAAKPYNRHLWLSLLGIEYDLRMSGSFWLGGRLTLSAYSLGAAVVGGDATFGMPYGQAIAIFRYQPVEPGQKFHYGAYAGLGAGVANAATWNGGLHPGVMTQLGGEVGYRWLRFSLEGSMLIGSTAFMLGVTPGISLGFPLN